MTHEHTNLDIDAAVCADYQRDGIVCLRNAFGPEAIEMLRGAVEQDMKAPSPMGTDATRDGSGQFFSDFHVWKHLDVLREFVFKSHAADIAREVLKTRKVNLLFDQFLIKAPGTSTPTVWHHDAPYWPVAGDQVCTVWIALDDVDQQSGAVEYVNGSHRWGQRYKAVAFKDANLYKEDLPPVPDIEAMRDELTFSQFDMAPGDCTVHHGLTVHGAPGNMNTTRWRRAYAIRWTGDDVTYNPRPNIQPMLHDPGIAAGAAMDCDLFPVVRTG